MEVKRAAAVLGVLGIIFSTSLRAEEVLTLRLPPEMVENGFAKHLLPRFTLRSRIRVDPVQGEAGAMAGLAVGGGLPVFMDQAGQVFHLVFLDAGMTAEIQSFADWLQSGPGRAAIEAFPIGGTPLYRPVAVQEDAEKHPTFDGDAARGLALAKLHCQRCHVVDPSKPFAGIGSSPSFAAMRSFMDWEQQFSKFYMANPHRGLITVKDVATPREVVPIAPIVLTLEQIDDILSYVNSLTPKDLGAPLQSR